MARQFRFYVEPNEVELFLKEIGYQIQYIRHRERDEIIGFKVLETTVGVGYDLIFNGQIVAPRLITLETSPIIANAKLEEVEQSKSLYRKLYNRFRNP